jgi:tRNA pseudouridine32 synthase/23S rRNA pseudouridine746 synthase
VSLPNQLNDPFDTQIPEIAQIAATEFKEFIKNNQDNWLHDFGIPNTTDGGGKGKMFGVLVIERKNKELGYLGTFSGKIEDEPHPTVFVPSLFDVSTDDYFITKGMISLTDLGNQIKSLESNNEFPREINQLKEERKNKSIALQQRLFEQYQFLNNAGETKSLIEIFKEFNQIKPAAGAGECCAPKLLHYAFKNKMKPIAIAEFWWGKTTKSEDRIHGNYYPSCNDKCRPILGYMLKD